MFLSGNKNKFIEDKYSDNSDKHCLIKKLAKSLFLPFFNTEYFLYLFHWFCLKRMGSIWDFLGRK